jgi:hypothetical protein
MEDLNIIPSVGSIKNNRVALGLGCLVVVNAAADDYPMQRPADPSKAMAGWSIWRLALWLLLRNCGFVTVQLVAASVFELLPLFILSAIW